MVALKMYVGHAVEIFAQKLFNHHNAPAHPYMTDAVVYTALFFDMWTVPLPGVGFI